MWKSFFDLVRQVLLLNDRMKRNQEGLTELRDEVRDLAQAAEEGDQHLQRQIERLVYELKRLESELQHSREREADARERLRLELENKMLREKRRLPPATSDNDKDDGSER